ncbi:DUF3017 domain-containing protein [Cellulomonas sp. P5_C6]
MGSARPDAVDPVLEPVDPVLEPVGAAPAPEPAATQARPVEPAEAAVPIDAVPIDAVPVDAAPVDAPPVEPPLHTGPIPVEEAPLDPRAIARASLDAARNASLWWTSSGIVVATLVALVVGTRAGAFVLAAVALACAVVRGVLPSPGPVALSVRAKAIDVAVLVLLGVGLAVLAQILPNG